VGGGLGQDLGAGAVAVQADEKIVVAGVADSNGAWDMVLWRFNSDGTLDVSFSADGSVSVQLPGTQEPSAVALQADGKIVVAGRSQEQGSPSYALLARFEANGALDPSFDADGILLSSFYPGWGAVATDLAIQEDGRILTAGVTQSPTGSQFALERRNPHGSLDVTFGAGGQVATAFGPGYPAAVATGVALDDEGRIVAAGLAGPVHGGHRDFALARYLPDGRLDRKFGRDGLVTTDFGGASDDAAAAVAIQPNGRIVVAGSTFQDTRSFALARYLPDGRLDRKFGAGGLVQTPFGLNSFAQATAVAVQADGKILAGGSAYSGFSQEFALVRYLEMGALDPSFGAGGRVTTDLGGDDFAEGMVLQPDGKILLAGILFIDAVPGTRAALARYLAH
jgi:uncharacterized delta-60 repeat protein